MATHSSEKASAMVFSRPIWSETQPKNGRVRPLVNRDSVSDSGSAAMPRTSMLATPKSLANGPTLETTIRPEVDIMLIITNSR